MPNKSTLSTELQKLKEERQTLREKYLEARNELRTQKIAVGVSTALSTAFITIASVIGVASGAFPLLIAGAVIAGGIAAYSGYKAIEKQETMEGVKHTYDNKSQSFKDRRLAEYNAKVMVETIKHDQDLAPILAKKDEKSWEQQITSNKQAGTSQLVLQ